jgi:outer membrane protein TolC
VVLESLRNVADVLAALHNDAQRLAALAAADAAAREALVLEEKRYALGAISFLQLLIARQQAEQTSLDLLEAQAKRLTNSIAFFLAMGGGP